MTHFEDILESVGSFGRYQKLQCFFVMMYCGLTSFQHLGNTFYSASADHYCKVYDNQSFEHTSLVKNCTIPYTTKGNGIVWDSCERYDVNLTQELSPSVCLPRSNETLGCDQGWVYDKTWYENTVVFEYNLVCENDWMKQLSKSIVPVGNIVGNLIFGQMSDTYGRRTVSIITLLLSATVTIITAFSPSYAAFVVGQFFQGVFPFALCVCGQVLMTEIVGAKYRARCIAFAHINFSLFYVLLGVIAWLCDGRWRLIHLIGGLAWTFFLPVIFFISESPMWLIQKQRYDECVKVLKRFAHYNRTPPPSDDIFEEENISATKLEDKESKEQKYTMLDLLKSPMLRTKTLVVSFNWFSYGFVYYGISLNVDQFADNPYTTFILTGFVEIPGRLLAWFLMGVIGRRWSLFGVQVIGGVALILSVIPQNPAVSITMVMLAKFCVGAVFTVVFVYGAELFPTVVRSAGTGISATCFGIGSMLSPYVILLGDYWRPLPLVIMGCMSLVPGLTVLLLPETLNTYLPGTIEKGEGEALVKREYNQRD